MTTAYAPVCANCSAPNLGTRFCESCGAQAALVAQLPAEPFQHAHSASEGVAVAGPRTNTLAILALIFGLLGSLLGVIFGHIALNQIRRTGEAGEGLAKAGLVFGYLWLVGLAIYLIWVASTVGRY